MSTKKGLAVPLMKRQRKRVPSLLKAGVGIIIDPSWVEYFEYRDICSSYTLNKDRALNINWLEYNSFTFQGVPCKFFVGRHNGLTYIKINPIDRHLKVYQCEYPLRVYHSPGKKEVSSKKTRKFLIYKDFVIWKPRNDWLLYSRKTRKFTVFLNEREPYIRGYLKAFEALRELHSKSPNETLECFKILTPKEKWDYFEAGPPWENVKFNPEVKEWM